MKAILEFDLPDEEEEHKLALNGSKLHAVLWNLDQWLRSVEKYQEVTEVKATEVREKLREELDAFQLTID